MDELLKVRNLVKHFPVTAGLLRRQVASIHAVDGVSFELKEGETLGLVGESGCGKSTVGRTIIKLLEPTFGEVMFQEYSLSQLRGKKLRGVRKDLQIIFQDPFDSLNPRHTVGRILEEPFLIHEVEGLNTSESRKKHVAELLERVGLPHDSAQRFPHEFSGGQRQRIGIARAIALKPRLIICDEPVSALDVSVQSQILNLLLDLQRAMNLAYLFIAHDLAVVRHMSDRIAVMYLGKIVESGDSDALYNNPRHPYTKALIDSIPFPTPTSARSKKILTGEVPSPIHPPTGCRFHTRCPIAVEKCREIEPELKPCENEPDRLSACHFT